MSLWDHITRRARTSPAAWAADAPTQPIPVVAASSVDGASWLMAMFDTQLRLNAATEARGADWWTDREEAIASYMPGMVLDSDMAAALDAAGVGSDTPWTAPESTLSHAETSAHPMSGRPMQGPSEATTAPRQETP